MLTVTRRPGTVHDYRALPGETPRYQLIQGEFHMAPAPNRSHQDVAGQIFHLLRAYLDNHPIGRAYIAPFDVYLTDIDVYQPDVCYFSEARYSYLTEEGAEGGPDIVVEVLSPKTAKHDLGLKREIYARTGVQELWIVDAAAKSVRIFLLQQNAEVPARTLAGETAIETPVLPGFSLPLAKVFAL